MEKAIALLSKGKEYVSNLPLAEIMETSGALGLLATG